MNSQELKELRNLEALTFDHILNSPGSWLIAAWRLKRTAEEIDTFSLPGRGFSNHTESARDRELHLLIPVYRSLLGLSFENLIKGIIIAHGNPLGSKGQLTKCFKQHSFRRLLGFVDSNRLPIETQESDLLGELQQYVLWAGRYPISKKVDEYRIALDYSYDTHQRELRLWDKLSNHLLEVGWFMKCGEKLPLRATK